MPVIYFRPLGDVNPNRSVRRSIAMGTYGPVICDILKISRLAANIILLN
jgi:hypothetical protein